MLGQTSLGADKSISKVNEQFTKHLDPQEVGTLETAGVITYTDSRCKTLTNNFVQFMNQPDSHDQSLLECTSDLVMIWTMDLEISQHHPESVHYFVLIKILWSSSGYKKRLTTSRSPMTVITANGEVQTHEEATVCVKELDIFLIVQVLENTPAVLSLGKPCDENGQSYECLSTVKNHISF